MIKSQSFHIHERLRFLILYFQYNKKYLIKFPLTFFYRIHQTFNLSAKVYFYNNKKIKKKKKKTIDTIFFMTWQVTLILI